MIIENLAKLLPRILLLIVYAISVAFLISLFNDDGNLSIKYSFYHPIKTLQYLYQYMKWWVTNKDNLSFSETFWVITSFIIPYGLFIISRLVLRSISTIFLLWVKKICLKFRRKFSKKQSSQEYVHHANAYKQDLNAIKYQMMKAAEHRIDEHIKKISNNSKK
ncbi:MAG: hypothetical protein HRK26_01085 [Rickettsiaceae bacterium H1]|nr:hypothetical protein [Rickettsiaceae bacterium H1]